MVFICRLNNYMMWDQSRGNANFLWNIPASECQMNSLEPAGLFDMICIFYAEACMWGKISLIKCFM